MLRLHKDCCGEHKADHHDKQKCGQNTQRPATAKFKRAKAPILNVSDDLIDDQIARDHKKYVDAHVPTGKSRNTYMRTDYRQDRNRSQAVDKWLVGADVVTGIF